MDINERFKEVRKKSGLNQTDFGAQIGVSRDVIANIEGARMEPKGIHVLSVCNSFNVNKTWLLSGSGNMDDPQTKEQHIADVISNITQIKEPLQLSLISYLSRMDGRQLRLILDQIYEEMEKFGIENPEEE